MNRLARAAGRAVTPCLLALGALTLGAARAAAQDPADEITLSSYTALAIAAAPEVRLAEDNFKAADADYRRAIADLALPTAQFNATAYPYGYNPDNDYQFNTWRLNKDDISLNTTFNLNIFDSFLDLRRVKEARAAREAARRAWDAVRQDRAYAAVAAYVDLDAKTALIEVARQSAADQKQQFERSQELYRKGMRGEADLLKSETDWRSSELRLAMAISDQGTALVAFNTLVARPQLDEASLQLDLSTTSAALPNFAGDTGLAMAQRPEVARARSVLEQARLAYHDAVQGLLPIFRVDATWNHTDTASFGTPVTASQLGIPSPNYYLGLSVALPFGYNVLSQTYAVKRARAERRAAEHELELTTLEVRREVAQAYVDLDRSLRIFQLADSKAAIARRTLNLVTAQYARGASDAIRMNQAQTDWLDASVAREQALHDILIDRAKYRRAVGDRLWQP